MNDALAYINTMILAQTDESFKNIINHFSYIYAIKNKCLEEENIRYYKGDHIVSRMMRGIWWFLLYI